MTHLTTKISMQRLQGIVWQLLLANNSYIPQMEQLA